MVAEPPTAITMRVAPARRASFTSCPVPTELAPERVVLGRASDEGQPGGERELDHRLGSLEAPGGLDRFPERPGDTGGSVGPPEGVERPFAAVGERKADGVVAPLDGRPGECLGDLGRRSGPSELVGCRDDAAAGGAHLAGGPGREIGVNGSSPARTAIALRAARSAISVRVSIVAEPT